MLHRIYSVKTYSRTCPFIFRFESTITAIFNGHTHTDQFNIYYAYDRPTHATGVAFNGASLTPGPNSNYKVYTVDSATYVSISDAKVKKTNFPLS